VSSSNDIKLDAETWDRLAGGHFYSTAAWLKFCAMHGGGDQTEIVAFADGEPRAALPVTELTAAPFPLYRWHELLAESGLPSLPSTGLLVGPRQGYQTNLLRDRDSTDADVAELVAELRHRAASAGSNSDRESACVAMYVPTTDAIALRRAGVTALPVLLDADAWLELPPGGWDGWMQSLPSRRRRNVRREVRAFRDAGYTVSRVPLADCCDQLAALAGATQAKYGSASQAADWLKLLQLHVRGMGDAAQVAVCRRGDSPPLAFCLYYVWDETAYLRWAGFDYARLAGAAEYFNLVFYENVAAAEELGVRRIHIGIKAPEAKALRGAVLRPLWMVDLSEFSPLDACAAAIRRHNRDVYERFASDARTVGALEDHEAWRVFC
jgi:hypothetical protein